MMLKLLSERTPEQKAKMLDDTMQMGRDMRRITEHLRPRKVS